MAILAKDNGQKREPIPVGNYVARCYQMIEIGTVSEVIQGTPKILHKVRIGWELPEELRVFGDKEQPLVISKEYTLSMNEKSNLRKDLKSWRGKDFTPEEARGFDITKLLGVPCMLNIIHKASKTDASKLYEEISAISSPPKSVVCPKQFFPTQVLSFDNFDWELFNSLPDFIADKIKSSLEYEELIKKQNEPHVDASGVSDVADDLPF